MLESVFHSDIDSESDHSSFSNTTSNDVASTIKAIPQYTEYMSKDPSKQDDYPETSNLFKTKSNHNNEPEIIDVPYSRFSHKAKMLLVLQCASTGFYSSIAASIYYPVLSVIETQFNISEEKANITVVVYFIFQGLAPSLMGSLADSMGRRPVILVSIMLYFVACIGLACSNTYAQIIGLRCLQAAGISPVIAINSGVMGDITTKAERGAYVGYTAGFQVIGAALGALIGALLANRWNWRAIFWFLTVGSGICLFLSFVFLPETKRTIVGNGSIKPKLFINTAPIIALPRVQKSLHLNNPDLESLEPRMKVDFLGPLKILQIPEVAILLFVAGFQFCMYTVHQTALTTALSKKYHYSVLQIGLCFLPSGICTLISVVSTGRFLNWFYGREMKKHQAWLNNQRIELMQKHHKNKEEVEKIIMNEPFYAFNLPKVRLAPALFTLLLSACGFIAFGWCVQKKVSLPAVLVCSGFGSLFSNCILTMSTTLIVDLFPSKSSTGTACLNLIRCSLSAIFIACLSKMLSSMNYGGTFTFMGVFSAFASLLLYVLIGRGKQLSFQRKRTEEEILRNFESTRMDLLKKPDTV